MGVKSQGAAAAMKDIEILADESGAPVVHLHGDAQVAAKSRGISKVLVSLSHSEVSYLSFPFSPPRANVESQTTAIAFAQAS